MTKASPSRRDSREPRALCFPFTSQRRGCRVARTSSSSCLNERDDSPSLGFSSPRGLVRPIGSPTLNPLGVSAINSFATNWVDVEGVDFGGENIGGLDHFPGAGAPRCGVKTDEFGPGPRLGGWEGRRFWLRRAGLSWPSALNGGPGLAHFEIGGAHFPRPAGVDVVSGEGGGVGLLLEIPHPLGDALT